MKKVEYLFDGKKLVKMDYQALMDFKKEYFNLLNNNPFPIFPNSGSFVEKILFLKRKDTKMDIKIGPYSNITPFEAANRIASDLIIINGLLQLIKEKPVLEKAQFTLRLGTTHEPDKGDFTIHLDNEESEGEAFNVAPSFLKQKMSKTINKWKDNQRLKHILVNAEAFEFIGSSKIDERVFKVENWYE